ncbi:imidazole glycerol phosphate synthase subunit HisH [Opitutales bacterium]|nr:imidazole glycerol phosphate synthase subunit HisH [Opitutales bacterium]
MREVIIVDFNLGNLHSVKKACEVCNIKAKISSQRGDIEKAEALILPGVGAFGEAMSNLSKLNLIDSIKGFVDSGRPLFGICIGLQLLFSESSEFGLTKGLDLISGKVEKISFENQEIYKNFRIPFIGWNKVEFKNKSTLLDHVESGNYFYFVHSYYARLEISSDLLASSMYGDLQVTAAIERNNIFATQFHPEKSGNSGLQIYHNWKNKYNLN